MAKRAAPYHHGDLRRALLAAALALLDEGGVEAVTIRAVARRTGVTHAAPANHFRGREALLTALAAEIFAKLSALISKRLEKAGGSRDARIRVFADAAIDFGLRHPHRFRLIWRRDSLDGSDEALNRAMNGIYDRLVAELAAGRGRAAVSADTQAIALWSMVHGYVCMRLDGNLVSKADEATGEPRRKAIVTAFLDGISGGAKK